MSGASSSSTQQASASAHVFPRPDVQSSAVAKKIKQLLAKSIDHVIAVADSNDVKLCVLEFDSVGKLKHCHTSLAAPGLVSAMTHKSTRQIIEAKAAKGNEYVSELMNSMDDNKLKYLKDYTEATKARYGSSLNGPKVVVEGRALAISAMEQHQVLGLLTKYYTEYYVELPSGLPEYLALDPSLPGTLQFCSTAILKSSHLKSMVRVKNGSDMRLKANLSTEHLQSKSILCAGLNTAKRASFALKQEASATSTYVGGSESNSISGSESNSVSGSESNSGKGPNSGSSNLAGNSSSGVHKPRRSKSLSGSSERPKATSSAASTTAIVSDTVVQQMPAAAPSTLSNVAGHISGSGHGLGRDCVTSNFIAGGAAHQPTIRSLPSPLAVQGIVPGDVSVPLELPGAAKSGPAGASGNAVAVALTPAEVQPSAADTVLPGATASAAAEAAGGLDGISAGAATPASNHPIISNHSTTSTGSSNGKGQNSSSTNSTGRTSGTGDAKRAPKKTHSGNTTMPEMPGSASSTFSNVAGNISGSGNGVGIDCGTSSSIAYGAARNPASGSTPSPLTMQGVVSGQVSVPPLLPGAAKTGPTGASVNAAAAAITRAEAHPIAAVTVLPAATALQVGAEGVVLHGSCTGEATSASNRPVRIRSAPRASDADYSVPTKKQKK
jgi:hypothetical protein